VKLAEVIESIEMLQTHMDKIMADQLVFGFDIETGYDGDDQEKAAVHPEAMKVVGISYAFSTDEGFYVPLAHDLYANFDIAEVARVMQPALQSGLGVAHNAKFEIRCLMQPQPRGFGYRVKVRSDTQIEAYILQQWKSVGLKALVTDVFGYEQAEYASLFPGAKGVTLKRSRFNHLGVTPEVVQYAVDDSIWCLALHLRHYDAVADSPAFKLEMQVLDVVVDMEDVGLFYDWDYLRAGAESCAEFIDIIEAEVLDDLSTMVGSKVEINLASNPQVAEVLYEQLGLPVTMRSKKTDKPSVGADALAPLAKDYAVVRKILWWKELKKLHGTYLAKYEKAFNYADDGRTHPNVMQAVVVSGRFAVSDPPYQQTPKKYHYEIDRGSWSFEFRPVIRPQEGRYFLYFDYSQVELRVVAALAQEQALLDAFTAGTDVHRVTASLMLDVPFEEVTGDQRDVGKTMNFALVYGMSSKMLAQRLAVTQERAEELFSAYFATYSAIKVWRDRTIEEAVRSGYTTSWLGRRHKIWEFESHDRWVFEKGERLAGNAPVQGGAADYMKVAMVRQHKALGEAGLLDKVRLVANVHDSLTWEVDDDLLPFELIEMLDPAVSFPLKGFPPITADWAVGLDWGNLVEVDPTTTDPGLKSQSVYGWLDAEAPPAPPEQPQEALPEPEVVVVDTPVPVSVEEIPEAPAEVAEPSTAKRLVISFEAHPERELWVEVVTQLASHDGDVAVHVITPKGSVDLELMVSEWFNVDQLNALLHPTGAAAWDIDDEVMNDLLESVLTE
jgi:DNA polymerase-1